MKKVRKVIVIVMALLVVTSCGVAKTNTAKTKDVNGSGVTHLPVLADLDVRQTKVTGTYTAMLKPPMVTAESIKQEAIALALAKVNGDILIEPFYKMESTGKQHTVTVTGYPATYKNFRMMEEKDTTLYLLNSVTQSSSSTTVPDTSKATAKNNGVKVVLGLVVVGALVGLITTLL